MNSMTTTWQRDGELTPRPLASALRRGAKGRCPACGEGALYTSYLKTAEDCPACGTALHHHRADDAPPYFTMAVVGHLIVPLVLMAERSWHPALWVHAAVWLPLTAILCLALLPVIKGMLVGLQWSLYMHGFDPRSQGHEEWDGVGFAGRGVTR